MHYTKRGIYCPVRDDTRNEKKWVPDMSDMRLRYFLKFYKKHLPDGASNKFDSHLITSVFRPRFRLLTKTAYHKFWFPANK